MLVLAILAACTRLAGPAARALRNHPLAARWTAWLARHPAVASFSRRVHLLHGPLPGRPVGVTGEPAEAWLAHGNLAIRTCLVMSSGLFLAGVVSAQSLAGVRVPLSLALPLVADETQGLAGLPRSVAPVPPPPVAGFAAGGAAGAPPAPPSAPPQAAAPPAAAIPPAAPVPGIPARAGALPVGKGMWIWMPERTDGGDVDHMVRRAQFVGLTHLYVRVGSTKTGFNAQAFLNALLPRAHAAGIRVYGWDFPWLRNWREDADRALAAVRYTTPDGHRIDGFAADIETSREGVTLSPAGALAYGTALRQGVGYGYPLIAVVPRAITPHKTVYPYPHVVAQFDAIAPMVYWLGREPGGDVAGAIEFFRQFGKPVFPIGQAYDGAPEGGPPGPPSRGAIHRFMGMAENWGAGGVSFWSWQHATQEIWDAIREAPWFVMAPEYLVPDQVRQLQILLTSLGFPAPVTGVWDAASAAALAAYQQEAGLPATGHLDGETRRRLLTPFPVPIRPLT